MFSETAYLDKKYFHLFSESYDREVLMINIKHSKFNAYFSFI